MQGGTTNPCGFNSRPSSGHLKTEERSLAGIVSLDNLSPQLLQRSRMPEGLHLQHVHVSPNYLSAPYRKLANASVSTWCCGFRDPPRLKSRGTLALVVASMSGPAPNAGGTTFNLQVSGSNPGRPFTGTVAQWDRAAERFLRWLSPQARLDFDCRRRMPKGLHGFTVRIRAVSRKHPEQ